jgi:hypothetical protein
VGLATMNLRILLSVLGLLAVAWSEAASAAGVQNGDFGTGTLSFWTRDTDGSPGGSSDFAVVGSPGNYAARIEADFHTTPGDPTTPANEVFLANTLHQELDTSALPGEQLILSFQWTLDGEDGDPAASETFLVGLNDGSGTLFGADGLPGHLVVPTSGYGGGSVEVALDQTAFNNVPGWSLDFQLAVGVDPTTYQPNALGSYAEIRAVGLPEPSGSTPVLVGTAALVLLTAARRRTARLRPMARGRAR